MKIYGLWACLFAAVLVFAQTEEDPASSASPPASVNSLSQMIASGVNYYSYVPTSTGSSSLTVGNLSHAGNHVLLVGEDNYGHQEHQIIVIEPQAEFTIPGTMIERFQNVYLVSLQPFNVRSEKFLRAFDLKTRFFTTVAPQRHLEMVEVEDALGGTFAVGVTPDGDAHYPVYGYKFGRLDRNAGIIEKPNGVVFDLRR